MSLLSVILQTEYISYLYAIVKEQPNKKKYTHVHIVMFCQFILPVFEEKVACSFSSQDLKASLNSDAYTLAFL